MIIRCAPHGLCRRSSVRLERRIVAPKVGGSIPLVCTIPPVEIFTINPFRHQAADGACLPRPCVSIRGPCRTVMSKRKCARKQTGSLFAPRLTRNLKNRDLKTPIRCAWCLAHATPSRQTCCSATGNEHVEFTFSGSDFRSINAAIENRIILEALLWPVAILTWRTRDAIALK